MRPRHLPDPPARGLRILMVTPSFHPESGGVETHVREVSRRLVEAGHCVTVATTDTLGRLPAREYVDGVEVRRVRAWPSNRDWRLAPGISRAVSGNADIVHVQSYHTFVAPLAMAAALRLRRPYVVTFHGGGHSDRMRNAARPLQLRALRPLIARAARLVAVAEFEIAHYGRALNLPHSRFVLIPNGAELPAPRRNGTRPQGTLIASVGRLERYKGHHRVLRALPHIIERHPDARLWIAGAGPYEAELRRMTAELGLEDRVTIRAIPPEDRGGMADALTSASLVALMSDWETHPVAALEAIGLERPLLVADNSGLRELAGRGLAAAIPTDASPRELAGAAIDAIARGGPRRPSDFPTWDGCATGLEDLYLSVVGRA